MMIDIFEQDAFKVMPLSLLVNKLPWAPTRLGDLGWFREVGVRDIKIGIELVNGVLRLVPDQPRGSSGVMKNPERRKIEYIVASHLPQRFHVMADEVAGLRAPGSESDVVTMQNYIREKAVIPRRDLDVTHEHHRIGAVKGIVMDADGTTPLVNLFTKFGVTQQTQNMDLDGTADPLVSLLTAKRKAEDALGMYKPRGWRALMGDEFFDAFVANADVKAAYDRWQNGQFMRDDLRSGFEFGKVIWEEYRGGVGAVDFIEPDCAYLVPEGIPDLFVSYYAPANYMDTVNQQGVPFYMSQERMPHNMGVEFQVQSNPLHMCSRPDAIIKLGKNAAALV